MKTSSKEKMKEDKEKETVSCDACGELKHESEVSFRAFGPSNSGGDGVFCIKCLGGEEE